MLEPILLGTGTFSINSVNAKSYVQLVLLFSLPELEEEFQCSYPLNFLRRILSEVGHLRMQHGAAEA